MPNLEWDVPMAINSPFTPDPTPLLINEPIPQPDGSAWLYQVRIDKTTYEIVPSKFRPVVDSLSQTDGCSIQPPFIDGLVATLEIAYLWSPTGGDPDTFVPAPTPHDRGREVLRMMDQLLMGALNSLRTYPPDVSTQQYLWTPTGATQRLLDGVMLGDWAPPDFSQAPEVRKKLVLACPYPYALTDAPHTTAIAAGTSGVAPNNGNTSYLPIIFIPGPFVSCSVVNSANGGTLSFDASRPGVPMNPVPGGHTLQIDMHEGSCLLDGNPALDYIAGLDPTVDNFFPLVPAALGTNTLTVAGANISVVSYDSWV